MSSTCPVTLAIGARHGGVGLVTDGNGLASSLSALSHIRIQGVQRATGHLVNADKVIGVELVGVMTLGVVLLTMQDVLSVGELLDFALHEGTLG